MTSLTLAQLDTLVALSPEDFPKAGAFAARRAIARIAQADGRDATAIPVTGAIEALERLRDGLPQGEFYDLRIYLRRALALSLLPADLLDRVRQGCATFADAAIAVDRQPKLRDNGRTIGAMKRFADKLAVSMDRLEAAASTIEPKLKEWTHAKLGIEKENFNNWRARLRKVIAFIALNERQALKLSQLTGPWFDLFGQLRAPRKGEPDGAEQKKCRLALAKLWPLVVHCHRNGVVPAEVSDATVQTLQAELARRGVTDPLATTRNTVYAWEDLKELLPAFPRQQLNRVFSDGLSKCHKHDFVQLPDEFRASWDDYVEDFFGANGLPGSMADCFGGAREIDYEAMAREMDEQPLRFKRKATAAANFKTIVTYAANAMIAAGETPRSINQIPTRINLGRVLKAITRRQQARGDAKPKNNTLYGAATILISIARDFEEPEEEIEKMRCLREKIDPHFIRAWEKDGKIKRQREEWKIGPRHAERLRAFNDESIVNRWFAMPYLLLAPIERLVKEKQPLNPEQTNDAIVALLHGAMRSGPLRNSNYAQLRIDGKEAHISLPAQPGTCGYIHVPTELTKNKNMMDIELTPEVADWFRFFLKHIRPTMPNATAQNPFLFPSFSAEGYRTPTDLNRIFKARNLAIGGFELNIHCARHVCAKLILDMDPANGMGLVQKLLGHKNIKTTESYYGQVNQIIVQRWYQRLLHERFEDRFGRAA